MIENEILEKSAFECRIENICKTASEDKVPVFIDAEESWIQDAIDNIITLMQKKYKYIIL